MTLFLAAGANLTLYAALACMRSINPKLEVVSPPSHPQPWLTYPWQGLLLVQCTLGLESRVPCAVGEEGTAWGGRARLREFSETLQHSSW